MGNDLGYLSHYPVLAAALAKTTGPVLELGMGWGSTPLLHAMCAGQRDLSSFETDKNWMGLFKWMEKPTHGIGWVDNWDKFGFGDHWWAVAFIDCAPGEIRKDLALRLKGKAKFIVMHDALSDGIHGAGGNYQYESIIPKFKYHEFYAVLRPATLILSDEEPFGLSMVEQEKRVVL